MEKKETIKKIPLLEGLTDEQVEKLEKIVEISSYKKDEKLFHVGSEAKNVFVLLDGKVSIQVQLTSRPENLAITVLHKFGQLVGWSGLMQDSYYTAAALCLEDSRLLKIDGLRFMQILEDNPEKGFIVMREISKVISNRLRNLQSVVLKTM